MSTMKTMLAIIIAAVGLMSGDLIVFLCCLTGAFFLATSK